MNKKIFLGLLFLLCLGQAAAQDVLVITEMQASESGSLSTVFRPGDSVDLVIFIDNDANAPQSTTARLRMTHLNTSTDFYDRTQAFTVSADSSTTVGFANIDLNSAATGNYVFTASIPAVGGEYAGNNSKKLYVTVAGPQPVAVPDTHPALGLLVALSVLFFIRPKEK